MILNVLKNIILILKQKNVCRVVLFASYVMVLKNMIVRSVKRKNVCGCQELASKFVHYHILVKKDYAFQSVKRDNI